MIKHQWGGRCGWSGGRRGGERRPEIERRAESCRVGATVRTLAPERNGEPLQDFEQSRNAN